MTDISYKKWLSMSDNALAKQVGAVSYTHLDVYKRQVVDG